jgi:hypothetical protein
MEFSFLVLVKQIQIILSFDNVVYRVKSSIRENILVSGTYVIISAN